MRRKEKDPRLPELSKTGPTLAADAPSRTETQTKQSKRDAKIKAKAERAVRPPRYQWKNRPEWLTTFLTAIAVGLILYVLFNGAKMISETLKQNQRHQTIANTWRQLLISNVSILGTPTDLDDSGEPSFPAVSFEAVRSKLELHRSLRLTSALPGVRDISLAPQKTDKLAAGLADDTTLELIGSHFPRLDSLNLSATKITTLQPIDDVAIAELNIINTPIAAEKLGTLDMCSSLTKLWIGWDIDSKDRDTQKYETDSYRLRLIDAISNVPNLKTVYLYKISFNAEERKELGMLELIDIN